MQYRGYLVRTVAFTVALIVAFTVTLTASNGWGSEMLSVPECVIVTEGEKVYLPLVVRNAP